MKQMITKETLFVQNADGQVVLSEEAIEDIRNTEIMMKKLKKDYEKYKKALLEGMETYGLKKVETDDILITYTEETERIGIDNDKLWKDFKDVAFQCQKFSKVKSSVRITVR